MLLIVRHEEPRPEDDALEAAPQLPVEAPPPALDGARVEQRAGVLAAGHDDWVPPNASCLCEGGAGPSAESQAFMDTFRERQDQHWIDWGHEVVAYVLTRALWVGLLPSLAFVQPRRWASRRGVAALMPLCACGGAGGSPCGARSCGVCALAVFGCAVARVGLRAPAKGLLLEGPFMAWRMASPRGF